MLWHSADLAAATNGRAATPFAVQGISIDSRTLRAGDLFIALRGENGDGHAHVAAALAAGAGGVLVDRPVAGLAAGAPVLRVADSFAALQALGAAGRARFAGRVIAITGSVGKTTTKEMLRTALAAQAPTHAAEASYNNHWGVPLTLARLPQHDTYAVIEIGMNHAGEIAPLSRLARPHVALVTLVGASHIGHLGSLAAIAAEKADILAGLEPGGVAILPQLPEVLHAAIARAYPRVRAQIFGDGAGCDARLLSVAGDAAGSQVHMRVNGAEFFVQLNVPGRHMANNAVAALAGVAALGADPVAGAMALAGFAAVAGRGARRPLLGGAATLLDESYNASGASMRAALDVLALLPARRRLAVLGDMLELGAHAASEHAALAPPVAAAADLLFACGTEMRHLYAAVPDAKRGALAEDAQSLAPLVAAALAPGDAVLVKGSLGSRMKLVVAALEREMR